MEREKKLKKTEHPVCTAAGTFKTYKAVKRFKLWAIPAGVVLGLPWIHEVPYYLTLSIMLLSGLAVYVFLHYGLKTEEANTEETATIFTFKTYKAFKKFKLWAIPAGVVLGLHWIHDVPYYVTLLIMLVAGLVVYGFLHYMLNTEDTVTILEENKRETLGEA